MSTNTASFDPLDHTPPTSRRELFERLHDHVLNKSIYHSSLYDETSGLGCNFPTPNTDFNRVVAEFHWHRVPNGGTIYIAVDKTPLESPSHRLVVWTSSTTSAQHSYTGQEARKRKLADFRLPGFSTAACCILELFEFLVNDEHGDALWHDRDTAPTITRDDFNARWNYHCGRSTDRQPPFDSPL